MAKALDQSVAQTQQRAADSHEGASRDWRKRMSDHVAWSLLAYTAVQIVLLTIVLESGQSSILPYFALVMLVVAVIPGWRLFEQRWSDLPDHDARNPSLAPAYSRDRALIWIAAFGLPLVMTGFFKGVELVVG